jgi:hypothetical protein
MLGYIGLYVHYDSHLVCNFIFIINKIVCLRILDELNMVSSSLLRLSTSCLRDIVMGC